MQKSDKGTNLDGGDVVKNRKDKEHPKHVRLGLVEDVDEEDLPEGADEVVDEVRGVALGGHSPLVGYVLGRL